MRRKSASRRRLAFSLLEIVLALALLVIASGALGWKVHQMIVRKSFLSHVEKIHSRLLAYRRLALNCQADWEGTFARNREGVWVFSSRCIDFPREIGFSSLTFDGIDISFEGEPKRSLTIVFTATGEVYPKGHLAMVSRASPSLRVEWNLPELFSCEQGIRSGPLPPEVLRRA